MASIATRAASESSTISSSLRRTGWLLIAPLLTFIVVFAYIMIGGDAHFQESSAAAEALDVSPNLLPAAEQARIAGNHAAYWVISGLLLIVPFALFALAMRAVHETFQEPATAQLTRTARILGFISLGIFVVLSALSLGLLADPDNLPPLVDNIENLMMPGLTVIGITSAVAVTCAALAVRRAGIAPKLSLAAIVVGGIVAILGVVVLIASGGDGLPPIVMMPPAALLGIGLVRSAPNRNSA